MPLLSSHPWWRAQSRPLRRAAPPPTYDSGLVAPPPQVRSAPSQTSSRHSRLSTWLPHTFHRIEPCPLSPVHCPLPTVPRFPFTIAINEPSHSLLSCLLRPYADCRALFVRGKTQADSSQSCRRSHV